MRGIRRWLTSAALLAGPAALAQSPALPLVPVAEPPIAAALPGGKVVGSHSGPGILITAPETSLPVPTPPVAAPIVTPDLPPAGMVKPPTTPFLHSDGPLVTPITTNATGCGSPGGECCYPVGAHGPIGQEVYVRSGASLPIGNGLLARGLNVGWATQAGGRAQFFDPSGTSAWVADVHVFYTYNNSGGQDVATFRGEPVTVRNLHRSGVGLGAGQDYFLAGPGYVGGLWDANLRYGWDAGARWGAGHVDLNAVFEQHGYRRHYAVFGQPYAGLNTTLEIPVGAYTCLLGGRVEWNYTFSGILPKHGNFQEVVGLLTAGVRY